MLLNTKESIASFKVNQNLGETIDYWKTLFISDNRPDWKCVPQHIQDAINNVTYALNDALKLSNKDLDQYLKG